MAILSEAKRAQSAMEYLMTYGWAILIITVVLVVLFSMGITNPLFFAPKAPPGGCTVVRPSGPRTTTNIELEGGGVCRQIPEYVAEFPDTSGADYILLPLPQHYSQITFIAWIKEASFSSGAPVMIATQSGNLQSWCDSETSFAFAIGVNGVAICPSLGYEALANPASTPHKWYQIAFTMTHNITNYYVDGVQEGSFSANISIPYSPGADVAIGPTGGGVYPFNWPSAPDYIANIQIYNKALSSISINSLYIAGIGAPPQDLNHIIGWWPLNGNANDYSGNNNDGVVKNIVWSGSWWHTYKAT